MDYHSRYSKLHSEKLDFFKIRFWYGNLQSAHFDLSTCAFCLSIYNLRNHILQVMFQIKRTLFEYVVHWISLKLQSNFGKMCSFHIVSFPPLNMGFSFHTTVRSTIKTEDFGRKLTGSTEEALQTFVPQIM